MNWANILLGMIIAGAAGYILEPDLRQSLTGEAPVKHKPAAKVEPAKAVEPDVAVAPRPEPAPAAEPKVDPAPVAPTADPLVTPPAPVDPVPTEPKADPVPAEPVPTPTPAVDPKMEEPKPAEPKVEEPKPEEPKAEEPKTDETLSINGKLTDEQVVKTMQSSFHSGDFKEFAADKANAWKSTGLQKIDGEVYQTGLVDYAAETIFGVKVVQAKALIQDGRVVKWISPKSGMEIK